MIITSASDMNLLAERIEFVFKSAELPVRVTGGRVLPTCVKFWLAAPVTPMGDIKRATRQLDDILSMPQGACRVYREDGRMVLEVQRHGS